MPDNSNTIGGTPLPQQPDPNKPANAGGQSLSGVAFNPWGSQPVGGVNDPTGGKMSHEQGEVYGGLYNQAQGMSGYFNQAAANYNQNAPTIGDNGQLTSMTDYYNNVLNGQGPTVAQNQMQQSTDSAIAASMAMAGSARGGAAARVGAERAAQQGAGSQLMTAANQSAQLRAQEQQAAATGLTNVGQLEQQRLTNNAQLQSTNQQQIDQMQTALYGMGEQEQGLSLSSQQAYMSNLLAAEGINTQQSQFNTQLGTQIAGAGAQLVGTGLGAAMSDEFAKTDVQPQGSSLTASYAGGATPSVQTPNIPQPSIADTFSHALNAQPQHLTPDQQNNAGQVGMGAGIGAGTGAISGAASGGPIGALVGAAGGAASGGLGAASQSHPNDQGLKVANTGVSTATGAAAGAAAGTAIYPGIGTAIGAVAGGIAGLVKGLVSDVDLKTDIVPQGLASIDWSVQ